MIEATRIGKAFSGRRVLQGIDLRLAAGERLALFGPNGTGKTTLIRIFATLSRPTSGRARVAGFDVVHAPTEVRQRIGVVGHQPLLYGELTAAEHLQFYARLYGLADPPGRAVAALARFGLAERARDLVRTFSRGMQQRLALARAILHNPQVLLLDEPDTGLDEQAVEILTGLLANPVTESERAGSATSAEGPAGADRRLTVLVATHNLKLGWKFADRCAILVDGRIGLLVDKKDLSFGDFEAAYRAASGRGRLPV